MAPSISTDMIKNLSGRERIFVDSFLEMLGQDNELLEKVCLFIASKTNDAGLIKDMKDLSGDGKCQACVEFVIIGLISRSIKVKELSEITQEYTERKPLIKDEHI
jgi:hypothetical protein